MDYRATVNLPQTEFPQRASLAQREPERLHRWQELDLYRRSLARREGAPRFELHDGPPYSNGHIHIGHVLNKVLKDVVVRYRDLTGHYCRFIPGWDNHGLPIEYAVTKELGQRGEQPDTVAIRHACRAYAQKWIDIQREEFERLGVRGDWANPYLTMAHDFEAGILATFANLAKQGYVYRGERIVQWAPSLRTALADAEIEYAEKVSPSVYVAFPVTEPGEALAGLGDAAVVIWTTTPWTIPANMAIAVHPEFEYRLFRHDGRVYLTADYLANGLLEKLGWQGAETLKLLPGAALEGVVARHPLYDRPSPLVFADYVTLEEGTGCVHTAPGHGKEDFETGRRYGLPAYCPVDEDGRFTAEVGERLAGRKVLKANDEVCTMLAEAGALLYREDYRHQYPHDWRAHEPIIFRATTQWFLNIDHPTDGTTHRQRSVEAAGQVDWYPKEGYDRIRPMVENRPDWCLSRQRAWGVGIPVFYCGCGETIMTAESLDSVVEVVRREGSDAWFELPPEQLLPDGFACPHCGHGASGFRKETDVLDVWFDSGSTHQVVYEPNERPVDLYLEGSDQHRGWFNSSLMVSVGVDGRAPYEAVVTHGFVLDAEGKAMSKSLGNVVRPAEVMEESGADVLRLWVASVDFYQDVRLGDEILKRVVDAYRNIRNSFRFLLGNLHDFDPCADGVTWDELSGLDRYVLYRLEKLKELAREAYEGYEFHKFVHGVHNFVLEVSAVYLDVAKDELYCGLPEGPARRAIQTVMHTVCSELATILAPVLVFTCDEVWDYLAGTQESVHLANWPASYPSRLDEALAADFEKLLAVRAKVKLAQEAFNQGKSKAERVNPLEMKVTLKAGRDEAAALGRYAGELRALFVVSAVELLEGEADETTVSVCRAEGHRCARSWRVFPAGEFGNLPGHPEVSDRDAAVVEWLKEQGRISG